MSLWVFICATGTLGIAAYDCARKHGDAFRTGAWVAVALAGGFIVAVEASSPAICIVLACVIVSAVTDLSSGYVYNATTYPSIFALLAIAAATGTVGMALMWAALTLAVSFGLYAVSRGRGIGLGDIKLLTVVAVGLYSAIGEVFAGSFVIGACFVGFMMIRGRIALGQTVPFAPFIAIATLVDVPYRWMVR